MIIWTLFLPFYCYNFHMIEKIENIAQYSFSKQHTQQSLACMQSFLFNLKNMKSALDSSQSQLPRIPPIQKHHQIQNVKQNTAELSIGNCNNSSSINLNSTMQSSSRSLKSQQKMSKTCTSKILPFSKLMENVLISQKTSLKEKYNTKASFIMHKKRNKQFRTKLVHILPKDQRYFQNKQVDLDQAMVEKLGLYESGNIFKTSNVDKFMKQKYSEKLKPVINLRFSTFKTCSRNQFFLTENTQLQINQNPFGETSRMKSMRTERNSTLVENNDAKNQYIDRIMEQQPSEGQYHNQTKVYFQPKNEWNITFNNYKIEKDQNYFSMKTKNIENWSDISFMISQIQKYLRKVKIMHLNFKLQVQKFLNSFWVCKKVDEKQLAKILKINVKVRQKDRDHEQIKLKRLFNNKQEVIIQLVRIWKDRKNLKLMKKNEKKVRQIINWIGLRMVVRYRMKKQKQISLKVAKDLNRRLRIGDWDHDVEIYLPSFSEREDIRQATQYMEYYQNVFYQIWNKSNRQIILILPAVNQNILSFLQERTKISNNVTIICPETHQLYPKTLPLAACLLYSSVAISKLKAILDGRKGIIIPGRNVSEYSTYQISLSNLLVCPLYCPLNDEQQNKLKLHRYLPSIPYRNIVPNSKFESIVTNLADLIAQYPKVNRWVFKINGQFNGRGFAFFDASSSKKLKNILDIEDIDKHDQKLKNKIKQHMMKQARKQVEEYLQSYFRLKLKVNFQNTIFRTQQFIQCFLHKGGIIQEIVQNADTYEICFEVQRQSQQNRVNLLNIAQIFSINFVVRSALYGSKISQELMQVKKKLEIMLEDEEYMGYVSVVVLFEPNKQIFYGIQIKCYLSPICSISFFINSVTNCQRNRSDTSYVLTQISTQRQRRNQMIFLFIPVIVFTDVDQMAKCELIQALTIKSWENLSTQLFSSSLFSNNSDSLCGSFYLSLGLSLGLLLYSRSYDVKKLKKIAIQSIRELSDKMSNLKKVACHQTKRDVFQISDIIRSITSIRI